MQFNTHIISRIILNTQYNTNILIYICNGKIKFNFFPFYEKAKINVLIQFNLLLV